MQAAGGAAAAAAPPACEPGQVLQLLLAALSHDQGMQKQAEQALRALEGQPGYISCLGVSLVGSQIAGAARSARGATERGP
jgi:hypothetical protein